MEPAYLYTYVTITETLPRESGDVAVEKTGEERVAITERVDRWKRQLRAELPDYMVPDVYEILPSFPLTSNGKIDRSRLPDRETGGAIVSFRRKGKRKKNWRVFGRKCSSGRRSDGKTTSSNAAASAKSDGARCESA